MGLPTRKLSPIVMDHFFRPQKAAEPIIFKYTDNISTGRVLNVDNLRPRGG